MREKVTAARENRLLLFCGVSIRTWGLQPGSPRHGATEDRGHDARRRRAAHPLHGLQDRIVPGALSAAGPSSGERDGEMSEEGVCLHGGAPALL